MDSKLIFSILAVVCFAIAALKGLLESSPPAPWQRIDWTAAGFCFSAVVLFLV